MARHLWPIDVIHIAFFTLQLGLQVVYLDRTRGGAWWLVFDLAAILGVFLVVWAGRRTSVRVAGLYRLVHGCLIIPPVFTQVGLLIEAMGRRDLAVELERIDRWLFGGINPIEALEPLASPLLTEVMQWAYTAYVLLPPATIILLAWRVSGPLVARSLFSLVCVFYFSYLGYYLVPAAGPNIHNNFGPIGATSTEVLPLYEFESELPGLFATDSLRRWMFDLELTKKDCFPSGHVAIAVACVILAWRVSRRFGLLFLPVALGVVLSTMYLRYHYVIDVIAGIALALVCVYPIDQWHRKREALLFPTPTRSEAPGAGVLLRTDAK